MRSNFNEHTWNEKTFGIDKVNKPWLPGDTFESTLPPGCQGPPGGGAGPGCGYPAGGSPQGFVLKTPTDKFLAERQQGPFVAVPPTFVSLEDYIHNNLISSFVGNPPHLESGEEGCMLEDMAKISVSWVAPPKRWLEDPATGFVYSPGIESPEFLAYVDSVYNNGMHFHVDIERRLQCVCEGEVTKEGEKWKDFTDGPWGRRRNQDHNTKWLKASEEGFTRRYRYKKYWRASGRCPDHCGRHGGLVEHIAPWISYETDFYIPFPRGLHGIGTMHGEAGVTMSNGYSECSIHSDWVEGIPEHHWSDWGEECTTNPMDFSDDPNCTILLQQISCYLGSMWDITGPPFQQTQKPNSRHYQIRAISNDFDDWDWDEDRKHTFPENTGDPYGSNNAKTIMGEVYKELTRIDLTNFNCWPPDLGDGDDDDESDSDLDCQCRVTKRARPFTPEPFTFWPNGPDEPPVFCLKWTEKYKQECFDITAGDPGDSEKFNDLVAGLQEKANNGDIQNLTMTRNGQKCVDSSDVKGPRCCDDNSPQPCCPDAVITWWTCPPGVDPPGGPGA